MSEVSRSALHDLVASCYTGGAREIDSRPCGVLCKPILRLLVTLQVPFWKDLLYSGRRQDWRWWMRYVYFLC